MKIICFCLEELIKFFILYESIWPIWKLEVGRVAAAKENILDPGVEVRNEGLQLYNNLFILNSVSDTGFAPRTE